MKSNLFAVLCIMFSNLAIAEDFRVLNFGETCENLIELEQDLGSQPQESNYRFDYKFENTYLDRIVLIIYACDIENKFRRGSYHYKFETWLEAAEFFNLAKPLLIYEYGSPLYDATEDDSLGLSTLWKHSNSEIYLSAHKMSDESELTYVRIMFDPSRQ